MESLNNLYKHSMTHPIVADAYIEEKEDLSTQILINEVPDTSVQAHMDFNPEPPAPTKYTITTQVSPEESGTVTGGGEYDENTEVTLTATPAEGYVFVKWNDDDTNSTKKITVTSDATYTAIFKSATPPTPAKYTITTQVSPEESGSVTDGGEYDENTEVTLTATPAEGYAFVKWNDENTDNPRTITVMDNATYTAIFEATNPEEGNGTNTTETNQQDDPNQGENNTTEPDEADDQQEGSELEENGEVSTLDPEIPETNGE